jgi:predicted transcriptional regulator
MTPHGAGVARAQDRERLETPVKSRRSLLDLAPLELDCMNTLWGLQEATVRDIRDGLAAKLPRAYTTIMTIMDRLTRKGVVERRKAGRSYVYRPQLSADEARRQAMRQVVDHFFGGSSEAAAGFLDISVPGRVVGPATAPRQATATPLSASPIDAPADAPILSSASPAPALEAIPEPVETSKNPQLPE